MPLTVKQKPNGEAHRRTKRPAPILPSTPVVPLATEKKVVVWKYCFLVDGNAIDVILFLFASREYRSIMLFVHFFLALLTWSRSC